MEVDTGEELLRAWLELAAIIWNRRFCWRQWWHG